MKTPAARRWLTFGGDHRTDLGQWINPQSQRPETVVEASYDTDSHTTRLGYAPGLHEVAK